MAETPNYSWPAMKDRKAIGQRTKRVDGPAKASGRAKYSSDLNLQDGLLAVVHTCPYAHARVTRVDIRDAERMKGVGAVLVLAPAGTEIQWEGAEIAAVAATSLDLARDAARSIKVAYEVLPHLVREEDLSKAGAHAVAGGEQILGDPDKAFEEADAVHEGKYGIPVITHCCLETHGAVIQWQGDAVMAWPSTQDVTNWNTEIASNIKVPAANIKVKMDYIGGAFGSKSGRDLWGEVAARLSQKSGGRPVKLFLDRATDQKIGGNRPSAFARIKIGGKKDGTITVFQAESWATGGFTGGGSPPIPYVFKGVLPNHRLVHTPVHVNAGPSTAWRAPDNQQASYLTCSAIEDFAAKIGMDPLEVYKKAVAYAPKSRVDLYKYQLDKAAELAEWEQRWHPRGQGSDTVRQGMGIGISQWAGGGHNSTCRTTINPDGSVLVEIGTQDLGVGTRTIIIQVVAETLGLPVGQIKLAIGSNQLPRDNESGGSTTAGGVSVSSRRSSMNALIKLFEAAAPALGMEPGQLEAVDAHIRVKGSPNKSLSWASACKKMGVSKISEMGEFNARYRAPGMNASGVAGVQIAEVSVDTETGVVKVSRYVAVQDCGLVLNPRLAESQAYGAIIMGISTALFEDRVMDQQTGVMLNPEMEFYKLAGIGDIPEILVHMDIREENDKRGVIGLGEPPAIAICAAVGNAVANALGVRVPNMPMSPDHVLDALAGRNA